MDRQWRYKSRVKSFRSNYPRYFYQQNPLSITFHSTPPLRGGGAFKGGGSTPRPRKLSPFRFIFELTPIKRRSRIVWFRRLERAFIKEKQLRLTKVSGASLDGKGKWKIRREKRGASLRWREKQSENEGSPRQRGGPNNETKPVRDGCSHGLRDVCAPWSEACKEIKSDCTPSRSLHPRYKLLLSGSCSVSRFSTANDERIEKMF